MVEHTVWCEIQNNELLLLRHIYINILYYESMGYPISHYINTFNSISIHNKKSRKKVEEKIKRQQNSPAVCLFYHGWEIASKNNHLNDCNKCAILFYY